MSQRIIVRLAPELFIKSRRTRRHLQPRLADNIADALAELPSAYDIDAKWHRLEVYGEPEAALARLSHVFGISSISPVEVSSRPDLEAILETGHRVFAPQIQGSRFAIRARRRGELPFRSVDLERQLGALLLPYGEVDLDDPEITVHVEVDRDRADFYTRRIRGAGGLPLGASGRALVLLSGGFDSAVAAWLMMKRGVRVDYVFCNLGGNAHQRSVLRVAKYLADEWSFGHRPRLWVVDFQQPLDELRQNAKPAYWQVLLKRMMYRTAFELAASPRIKAIVTGESIGQVSSQTLENLCAIDADARLPVLRPLIGLDKQEIIDLARTIGTADLSRLVKEHCAITPQRPVTSARLQHVLAQEKRLDPEVVPKAAGQARAFDLRSLAPSDLVMPYVYVSRIEPGAVVIDCRPAAAAASSRLAGVENIETWDLMRSYKSLDREATYVLYCAAGTQSAYLAEQMQSEGYEAYAFRGDLQALRQALAAAVPVEVGSDVTS